MGIKNIWRWLAGVEQPQPHPTAQPPPEPKEPLFARVVWGAASGEEWNGVFFPAVNADPFTVTVQFSDMRQGGIYTYDVDSPHEGSNMDVWLRRIIGDTTQRMSDLRIPRIVRINTP